MSQHFTNEGENKGDLHLLTWLDGAVTSLVECYAEHR